jgi:hypothetical protein
MWSYIITAGLWNGRSDGEGIARKNLKKKELWNARSDIGDKSMFPILL